MWALVFLLIVGGKDTWIAYSSAFSNVAISVFVKHLHLDSDIMVEQQTTKIEAVPKTINIHADICTN